MQGSPNQRAKTEQTITHRVECTIFICSLSTYIYLNFAQPVGHRAGQARVETVIIAIQLPIIRASINHCIFSSCHAGLEKLDLDNRVVSDPYMICAILRYSAVRTQLVNELTVLCSSHGTRHPHWK